MNWRSHLPNECPPKNSEPASGSFYRLIVGINPVYEDFLSHRELYPDKKFFVPECQVGGVSIYPDIDGVMSARNRIPAFRKKYLALGHLKASCGNVKNTPSYEQTHHTWWIPMELDPSSMFAKIDFP